MCTIGSRCPTKLAEKGLALHWDDGMKRKGYNEFALDIPDNLAAKCHGHTATVDGTEHTFDLSDLYADYPEDWKDDEGEPEVEPAPKEDTQIAAMEIGK